MKQKLLLISSIFFFFCIFNAQARKPAVEDFVGVIPDSYQETPKGTEVLYDFSKKIDDINKKKTNGILENSTGLIGLSAFLVLPFLMWFFITRQEQNSTTSHSNKAHGKIADLETYRSKKQSSHDDDKKAS
jgi:hypothetical protein